MPRGDAAPPRDATSDRDDGPRRDSTDRAPAGGRPRGGYSNQGRPGSNGGGRPVGGGDRDRGDRNDRGDRGDRGFREGPPRGTPVSGDDVTRVPGAPNPPPFAPPADAEDQVDYAGRTLRDVLNLLGMTDTEIAAREPETAGDGFGLVEQVLEVYGANEEVSDELGLLIGRRGETLAALQYIINVLVATKYGNDHVVGLDIEQYRKRREQTLIEMARRIAAEVRETGDVITLEPMPPAERRIIHLTMETEAGVRTESVGQGENRQVEVLPADGGD